MMHSPLLRRTPLPLLGIAALALACAGEDGSSGGTGTGAQGGNTALAGQPVPGAGGQMTGAGGQMAVTPVTAYWPTSYDAAGAPIPADSGFHAGQNPGACILCHGPGGTPPELAFGGAVFHADGATPAANVQVGVTDGVNQYFVYSSTNGLYWATGSSTAVNWNSADIRLRTAAGEYVKTAAMARGADCDSCHQGALVLTVP